MNILIPLAGKGSRFINKFENPKPLIEFDNKPIIQHVVESIKIKGNYIFIIQKEHNINNKLSNLLKSICVSCEIIEIDYYTDGAAQTCYLAEKYINNDQPLFITNCDQIYDWDPQNFVDFCINNNYDGVVITEKKNTPTYSYIKLDQNNLGLQLAEKKIISEHALIGMHYWKKGSYFVMSAKELIDRNIRERNEYYLSLTYNILIEKNLKITSYQLKNTEKYYVVGTPKELFDYLNFKNIKLHNTDLVIAGHITKDTTYDIYNNFKPNYLLGGIMNFWDKFVAINKKEFNVELSPLSYGESIILIDKQKCERYNRSQLNIKKINSKINNANWFHMMYINELIEYNDDLLSKTKSMVISGDVCGGVDKKKFNIELLKYFDFLFLSIDDLHNEISINDIRKHIKGYIIIHNSHHCEIVGNENSLIKINVELDKTHMLTDVNVLGAGDYFAASFIYFMLNKDIHDMEMIQEAIIFSHKEVSNKLKFN
jgi:dTDP-glucose pyrophosphorylase